MTALTRWDPIREIQALQNQFSALLQPFGRFSEGEHLSASHWMPAVDLEEGKDALYLRAEVPGMRPEDIDIQFENGVLTIRGERKLETKKNDRQFHLVERSYGSFARSFTLPRSVNPDAVKATYDNGVLELEMPKREESKARRIPLSTGSGEQKRLD